MAFPQINQADNDSIHATLQTVLRRSEARLVLFVERAGYLIASEGDDKGVDATTMATLATNAYGAIQYLAERIEEPDFNAMYQQGEKNSLYWLRVDDDALLLVLFPPKVGAGMVKLYGQQAAKELAAQLAVARERAPAALFDPADKNPAQLSDLFKRDPGVA